MDSTGVSNKQLVVLVSALIFTGLLTGSIIAARLNPPVVQATTILPTGRGTGELGNSSFAPSSVQPSAESGSSTPVQNEMFEYRALVAANPDFQPFLNRTLIVDLNETIPDAPTLQAVLQEIRIKTCRLNYSYNYYHFPASFAWKNGSGDCTEFSAVFCSMARNQGVPCRVVSGTVIWNNDLTWLYPHLWVEVVKFNNSSPFWAPIEVTNKDHDCILEPLDSLGSYNKSNIMPYW